MKDKNIDPETRLKLARDAFNVVETREGLCIEIKDVSQLSAEVLEDLPDIKSVLFVNPNDFHNKEKSKFFYYTREQYIEIRNEMTRILEGIEKPIKGDFESEFKVFSEVCQRLANLIEYDHIALEEFEKRKNGEKYDAEKLKNSQNLYGGLIANESGRNKTVCAGYSRILMNALSDFGIDCKVISGKEPGEEIGHAWNQVNIGGQWFNFDLTWERDEIASDCMSMDYLKTDAYFKNHDIYSENRPGYIETCNVPAAYVQFLSKENPNGIDEKIEVDKSIVLKIFEEDLAHQLERGDDVFRLTFTSKLELILCLDDKTKIEMLARKRISLPDSYKKQALHSIGLEFAKECIDSNEDLSLKDKSLLLQNQEPEYIIKKISSGMFDDPENNSGVQLNDLIVKSKNVDFIEECLLNGRFKLNVRDIDEMFEVIGFEFEDDPNVANEWNDKKDEIKAKVVEQRKTSRKYAGITYLKDVVEAGAKKLNVGLSEVGENYRSLTNKLAKFFDKNKNVESQNQVFADYNKSTERD